MPHSIPAFFESYAQLLNRALSGEDVFSLIEDRFAPQFIAAGPDSLATGKPGAAFRSLLQRSYRFYRQLGAKKVTSRKVETTQIDPGHALAKVFYCSDYQKKDGGHVAIEFNVTYLMDLTGARPKIFAFVSGDEMELYRKHGLIPKLPEHAPVKPRLGDPATYVRKAPPPAPGRAPAAKAPIRPQVVD
jgi:hypothetical protein